MLFLGAISYGQQRLARTYVHQYDRGGEKIYTLKHAAQQDCSGHEDSYRIELYDRFQGNTNVLIIGDTFYQAIYDNRSELVSTIERNKDDYRNEADEQAARPTPTDYWDSDFNLVDPFCNQHSNTKYLTSKSNYDSERSTSSRFHYGPRGDVYIDTSNGFTVRFGATEWTETQRHRAYDRIRWAYSHSDFEQNLIARGFVESNHHTYEWEQICPDAGPSTWNWRVDVEGNSVNLWSVQTSTALDLSFATAIERIDARICETILPHEIREVREITSPNSNKERYEITYAWNQSENVRVFAEVYNDITGELEREFFTNRLASGTEEELEQRSLQFDVDRPELGHRYRIEVSVSEGEGGDSTETFYGDVNADQNIIIKDFAQGWVRFWTVSNITNNDDRVNVRALQRLGGRVRHSAHNGWKRITPNRVLADGYTKEYIYRHPTGGGNGRVENFQTIEVNAQRDGQGEFTAVRVLQGPKPRLRVRLGRNNEGNKGRAEWRLRTEWELNLPPQWDESQILGITTSGFSEEPTTSGGAIYRWIREQRNGLTIDQTRHPDRNDGENQNYRNDNFWRFTDNPWEFTLTFLRREPIDGRLERYTIRYHSNASGFQPGTNSTTDRNSQYNGGTDNGGVYYYSRSSSSHWGQPSWPNSLLAGQRQ